MQANTKSFNVKQSICIILIYMQIMPLQAYAATALGADAAVAGAKPIINSSSNGIPIIQIVPPNTLGVSHNRFTQYNIGPEGQILNNSGLTSSSVLAGTVAGNPMLGNSNARMILNEVTSANQTTLNGAIEITGKRADLVIANPNGITVNGGSFINTGRAVLTTGRSQLTSGMVGDTFSIQQGLINIQGSTGLDARGADQLLLLSRSLQINANLYANQLNVVTGPNLVNSNTGTITTQTGTGANPTIAVDVSNLGGMYANSIYLVGTESGVGVNSKGKMQALTGDIQLSSAGDITVTDGKIKAAWDIRANAKHDMTLQGTDIQADGNIELITGHNLNVTATRVDTSSTAVLPIASGTSTTTNSTTEYTGSVLQAAGDISLVANTAINSIATLTAASYATLRSQQEANISTLQSQVVSVKPAYDIALTQPSSISSAAAITTYNSAINNLQIAQTNFQQLIDTYSGGKITLSGSGLRSESNIMVSAADITINSVANSKLARNVNYTNSTSCSWLGLVCNTTTTTATTQKLEENLKGGDVTSLGDLSIFALGNRDPSGNLFTESGNFLVLGANKSKISSDVGHIQLTAANDIAIEANQSRHSQLTNAQTSSQSSFIFIPITNSSNLALDAGAQYTAEGSTVTANSIQIRSGRDTLVRGSILSADRDIQIVTGRDIDIVEARDLVSYQTIRDSKKSGLFNNGDGLFGITLGSTNTTQASSTTIDTASASQIASIAGGISIFGGRNVLLQGADMTAGMNIDIIGDNVSIMAAKNVYNQEDSYKARTSGLTLALKGAALGHFESAWQASQKSKRAEDSRLKAAYDFKAGYDLYRAVRETPDLASLNKGFNDLLSGNPTTALQATGINLELSLGSSSITSSAVQKQTDWRATNLFSNGDTTIIARSPVVGQTGVGKLDIMGSNLDANNITISAGTSLSARNSVQTTVSRETSSNTSASVGVGLGTQGLYATASGQIGNTLGQAFKEDNGESHLTASNKLTLLSGGNVDLKGAVARASRIETDVAGSLTVTSLQDSERYQYKSSNAGGSISVPIYGGTSTPSGSINSSTQNISNQYQSVVQQSGLFAGDNGFSIKVGGFTNLMGGAIVSTAPVTLNQLTTGYLFYSDISNKEQISVSGYTFGLGTGAGSNYVTPVPNLSGVNRNSITQSIISPGTIQVTLYTPIRTALTNQQSTLQTQISNLNQQLIGYPAAQTAAAQSQAKLDYYVNAINYYFSTPNPSPANYYINLYNLEKANLIQLQSSLVTYQNTQTLLTAAQNSLATTSANISALDGMVPTLTTRTIATANSSLNNTFDIAKTRNAIEAMAVFSETAMRAVGDSFKAPIDVAQKKIADSTVALNVAKQSGNATAVAAAQTTLDNANASLDTLRGQQILAHGIVGGLTATLGGTNPTTGFVGGVAGKTVALVATDILAKSNIDPQSVLYQQLITLAATAAGSITGGTTGGFIASQGDRFNRQLHMPEFEKIKAACGNSTSTIECQTIQRMTPYNTQARTDIILPADNVIANYNQQGNIVSYTLSDKTTNQPWLIMEPSEFKLYKDFGYIARADYQKSSQAELDQTSYVLYAVNGQIGRAMEHLTYVWSDPQTLRSIATSIALGMPTTGLIGRLARLIEQNTAFTSQNVFLAYQGMRNGGGHAMRHFIDEGLLPNAGSLASRAQTFENMTSNILTNPTKTFDWRLVSTPSTGYVGNIGGKPVVVFVATEGQYQGKVISAIVPDAKQLIQWGIN